MTTMNHERKDRLFPIVNDMVMDISAAADGRTIERRRRASRRAVAAWHAMTAQAKDQLIAHLTSTDPDALRRFFLHLNDQ